MNPKLAGKVISTFVILSLGLLIVKFSNLLDVLAVIVLGLTLALKEAAKDIGTKNRKVNKIVKQSIFFIFSLLII
jgi:hypothetical protein